MKNKIFIIVIIISIITLASLIIFLKNPEREEIEIKLTPKILYVEEGKSAEITLILEKNASDAEITWRIEANESTGWLEKKNDYCEDNRRILEMNYFAPYDVDEEEYKVKIIAILNSKGYVNEDFLDLIVYPKIYKTEIDLNCSKNEVIAGETCFLKASLVSSEEKKPIENASEKWSFFINGKKLMEKVSYTDKNGLTEIPFFLSNVNETSEVEIFAEYERNLSGYIDYEGSSTNIKIRVIPEKPGDFPVILIHGWIGSISSTLLNYTWWNLTQKLQEKGFKVLDFDLNKPGIQWLTYEPEWQEHHIPWIAAKVSQKIRDALVLNGYSPNQTIDIVAHSMGGLIARFMAEHYMEDVDYWNDSWDESGYPWYGDGDADVVIGAYQIDDLIAVGTPCHGVPPNINEYFLKNIIKYTYFPWWVAQVPDMVYNSPFLQAMGYNTSYLIDYYSIGGDIGIIFGDFPRDFDNDGIARYSDGLCPTESPYLEGRPIYILEGAAWPLGKEDHISLIAINEKVHDYIIERLIN
ncbi:MAG: alpha/beta fold hydrolase [Candidatus Thermoplasmatota archaeon]